MPQPMTLNDLRDIECAWQKGVYVNFPDRSQLLDLAAVGVLVQQLANSETSLSSEMHRIIEIAQSNRKALR